MPGPRPARGVVDRRRLAIATAAGVLAGALTAAIAIPATTPSTLDLARDAEPRAESDQD